MSELRDNSAACAPCKTVLSWRGKPLLRDALCPKCGRALTKALAWTTGERVEAKPMTRGEMQDAPLINSKGEEVSHVE